MEERPRFENLIKEADLCELLGVNKLALGRLRNEESLPCLKVNQNSRVYLESDVIDWLLSRRTVKGRSRMAERCDEN